MLWCTETCNASSLPYQDWPSQQTALGADGNKDSMTSISISLPPKDHIMVQSKYSISVSLHWSALMLQQYKPKKSRNHLLDLLCQHLRSLQFSRKREKSWSSCSGHSRKWTGLDSNLSVLLLILFKKNNKHAVALCFYRTCHWKSYSFLKISAHTPHLQKNALLFKSYKHEENQACR